MKNNRVYVSKDALAKREDFDAWYADGDTFLSFKSNWTGEGDKVRIFGRLGGEMGSIKPDPKKLTYYLKLERWEYVFHTRKLFEDYYVNGMKWQIYGSLNNPPLDFLLENDLEKGQKVPTISNKKDVHVRLVDNFRDRGECYEIKCNDVAKLRIATAAVIAMAIKEQYKGLSEGLHNPHASRLTRAKNWLFAGKGKTYEQLLEEEAEAARAVQETEDTGLQEATEEDTGAKEAVR